MIKGIGIKFRKAGKIYFFKPMEEKLLIGDKVIVETSKGIEMGEVASLITKPINPEIEVTMRDIIRKATSEDMKQVEENKEAAKEAYALCKEKIRDHGLDMKLSFCEYTFDKHKLLFYFTADNRIDFRELVKDLASIFKTRIELRQIGVRDETKMMGGLGMCGRELCCASYMREFAPVSIKMAKDQNLSLNPTKISGMCGRLMCCLNNEEETYKYLTANLPSIGKQVTTLSGVTGEVKSVDILRQRVSILIEENDEKTLEEFSIEELGIGEKGCGCKAKHSGCGCKGGCGDHTDKKKEEPEHLRSKHKQKKKEKEV